MAHTLYFYDLETTGFKARSGRVMQFAGQRTDMDLKSVGKPDNFLIKLSDDTLPDPQAIFVTGITPQKTIEEGLTEAAFLKFFTNEIAVPDTIFTGFNTVRFDDEFMRFMHYRNFYDPYEWQWRDGRSRWDLLDVVRMTRALRPDGIKWPVDENGIATNTLTMLTGINGLDHEQAHDALNDVNACIALAKLLKQKQPKLFEFLLRMRDKKLIAELVGSPQPFIYTSGKYPSEFEKTTVAVRLADNTKNRGALVYDLRHDPTPFLNMTPKQLAESWQWKPKGEDDAQRLPVKTLQYNRCPAVAPLSVLDKDALIRLKLDMKALQGNIKKLQSSSGFLEKLRGALAILDEKQDKERPKDQLVDSRLYDGFFDDNDKVKQRVVRAAGEDELPQLDVSFTDTRLNELMPLYKARNYPGSLSPEEQTAWETYRRHKLLGGGQTSEAAAYFNKLQELSQSADLSKQQSFLLQELQLWGESILPEPTDD